jgi:UPF0716 protein FxsA
MAPVSRAALAARDGKLVSSVRMLTHRTVLGLLRPDSLRDLLFLLLLWALVPLGEIMLLLYLGSLVGTYLVLAVTAATTLIGILVIVSQLRGEIAELMRRVSSGEPPGAELSSIAGALAAAFLLLSPGLVTDLAAFVLMSPRTRGRVGGALLRRMGIDAKAIHEYLKLSEGAVSAGQDV